jgi:5-methylcytosine-specific restriction endonuclease McrA
MGKKLPYTPNSRLRSALRQMFLRSRERASVLKKANYRCQECGKKQSRARGREVYVEVHHRHGIKMWDRLFELIRAELLNEDDMEVLCVECHKKHTDEEKAA